MRKWALIIVFALFLFAMLFALSAFVKGSGLGNEFSLPLLAIAGVMALIGSLAVVAVSFSLISMSDRTQALGLPNGSVRAVIALSLVILFAILTVYLFSTLHDGGPIKTVSCLDAAHRDDFVHSLRPDQLIGTMQNQASAGGLVCADEGPFYMVYFRDIPNPASEDFAKQLLVLIGALVTTVSGFYFGSKATSDGRDAASLTREPPPGPTAVSPATLGTQDSDPVTLTITGNGLNSVTQVRIVSGDRSYSDSNVVSNAGRVVAHVAVPAAARTGVWDLILIDALGRQARLRDAITMGSGGPGLDGAVPPKLTIGRRSDVAFAGSGLAGTKAVELVAGTKTIAGTVNKGGDRALLASFDVPKDADASHYDVVVIDSAGKRTVFPDKIFVVAGDPDPATVPRPVPVPQPVPDPQPAPDPKPEPDPQPVPVQQPVPDPQAAAVPQPEPEPQPALDPQAAAVPQPEPDPRPAPDPQPVQRP